MMKNKYYYILFVILIALSCCKKNNSSPIVFTEASYPIAVGNWWQYQFTDYLFGGTDTFMLSVDSVKSVGPYTEYICNYHGNGTSAPAGYFLRSDTSLSFIYPSINAYNSYIQNFHLKFPVETGQYWQGDFPGDSTLVVGVAGKCDGSYGESFSPCFSTVESYILPHNLKDEIMTLTPRIGVIYQSINFISDTAGRTASYGGGIQVKQSIALISYHVQ
jgi:hypothetical protein